MEPTPSTPALSFASDNVTGAAAPILEALLACNAGQYHSYGDDDYSQRLEQAFRQLFEHDSLKVFLVATGTAANALGLSLLTPPWGHVFCHPESHINQDECNAPGFFSHGAKLVTVPGDNAKLDPAQLQGVLTTGQGDVHMTQPAAVSLTQATELGTLYQLEEIRAIGALCREAGLRLHMDGARFANALEALGCTPAQMTWQAGVEVLSFGATKNGALGVEAVVLFDPSLAEQFALRRKRGGHLFSKMRFLAAQMEAYLADDLWRHNARQANAMARRLADGLAQVPGLSLVAPVEANILFCQLPLPLIAALLAEGFDFYHDRWAPGVVRLVTSFATQELDVDHLLARVQALAPSCR
ncbi:low specificity L-threonine aldolase [Pseudaeromonas sp. ZJS20]|uniref:threonine aldolase family protein n=1 Tax=Pseudaeromonas aegiceratis TaxID=3153928 RepID=UPI00390C5DAC